MKTRRVSADRLRWTAHFAAVKTYRAAFKAGRLGDAHGLVVDEAFQLAGDELLNRANIERRQGRGMLGALLLNLAGWMIATGVADAAPDSLLVMGFKGLAVYLGIALVIRYESAGTYRSAAKLLTAALPPEKRAPAANAQNDMAVTTEL